MVSFRCALRAPRGYRKQKLQGIGNNEWHESHESMNDDVLAIRGIGVIRGLNIALRSWLLALSKLIHHLFD